MVACLQVLDEPAVQQSDPAVLNLQLRQLSRDAPGARLEVVGKVEHRDSQKAKRIGAWVQSIAEVHKNRTPSSVAYSQPMPDVEVLMQEWPPELEAALNSMKMPSSQLVSTTMIPLVMLSLSRIVICLVARLLASGGVGTHSCNLNKWHIEAGKSAPCST